MGTIREGGTIGRFGCGRLASILLLLSSCGSGGGSSPSAATTPVEDCNFQRGGNCFLRSNFRSRSYILHVPATYQPNVSALVLALHGSGGSGAQMEAGSRLSFKADEAGFAVAYPDALRSAGGSTQWSNYFSNGVFDGTPPDDVRYLRDLINSLQVNLHPNPKRIYCTGVSNGALMAHRVGVELSDLVAAIGVVEGALYGFGGSIQGIPPARAPVSVLILHGDEDSVIPYCPAPTFGVASQETSFNYWVTSSGVRCERVDTTIPLCDGQGNITAISEKTAGNCSGNTEVKFYRLIGGVHDWYLTAMDVPGQVPFNPAFDPITGVTTNDILWNFFDTHAMP